MFAANVGSLKTQAVRDLAFLLDSPSPWCDAADITPSRLLGEQGWPHLLALDAAPQPLLDYLAAHPVRRLGFYAERLLAFWFAFAPHIDVIAANLAVRDGQHTVGEFDFLLRVDGKPLHLEAASKFYLQLDGADGAWVGASLRDALLLKARKTARQLQLTRHPAACLPDGFVGCEVAARTSGWLFFPAASMTGEVTAPLNPQANRGWWVCRDSEWPKREPHSRWCHFPRLRWLSLARVDGAETVTQAQLQEQWQQMSAPQLVAEVCLQPDGAWHEIARGFVVPPDWPQPLLLDSLLARLSGPAFSS